MHQRLRSAVKARSPDRNCAQFVQRRCLNSAFGRVCLFSLLMSCCTLNSMASPEMELNLSIAQRMAALALDCVHREYPNKITHVMQQDSDAQVPRALHPAFYGCFDWHSSVHGHWLMARLLGEFPTAPLAKRLSRALDRSLKPELISVEAEYFRLPGRASYERPYGMAWLLQLSAELHQLKHPRASSWQRALEPLERVIISRLMDWLAKLDYPIRAGEHSQTAFAFGLFLDWAEQRNHIPLAELLRQKSRSFYLADRNCPLAYEPSGQDFLSPCLAQADLMRRVLDRAEFNSWLNAFLPQLTNNGATWLPVAKVSDRSDGKLAHLDGLNLSRAWMLQGIAAGLPETDPRRQRLLSSADEHAQSGLAAVTGEHYEGGHWLASFAVYLLTRRGVP